MLIDNWTIHGATDDTGTITLTADKKYQTKQVIPQSRLYPPEDPTATFMYDADGNRVTRAAHVPNDVGAVRRSAVRAP